MLKCNFCGKCFKDDDFENYVKCVNACAKQKREQSEAEKKAKLEKERTARWEEVVRLHKLAKEKYNAYVKDYGKYVTSGKENAKDDDFDWCWPFSFDSFDLFL